MDGLTRFIKGDTIKMDGKTFKLSSDGYWNDKLMKLVCDVEGGGHVSYIEMMEKDAKIVSYEKKFKYNLKNVIWK